MEEKKLWRLFDFQIDGKVHYQLSERPMTEAEKDEVFKRARYNFDLDDLGVDFYLSANVVTGCYSSESKEHCEEVQKRLEAGESIFEAMGLTDEA